MGNRFSSSSGTIILPTGVAVGTYGDGTHVGQFQVQADGRLVSAASVPITFPTVPKFASGRVVFNTSVAANAVFLGTISFGTTLSTVSACLLTPESANTGIGFTMTISFYALTQINFMAYNPAAFAQTLIAVHFMQLGS